MNIHQLSVSYEERQDRVLLRLNTLDKQEFRFWLTRRMCLRLLPAVDQSVLRLEASQPGVAVPDASSKQMLTEIKRDAFLQKADFSTPFEAKAEQRPLGEEPLLITDAQLSLQTGGGLQMTFQEKSVDGAVKSCQLNLQASLVHGLLHLIHQALVKADWGITAAPHVSAAAEPAALEPKTPPRYPH
jgi:hypothetical protein